eukprot:349724_1
MVYRTDCISQYTQRKVARSFAFLGAKIDRYPWKFIVSGIILTIACSFGLLLLEDETRSLYLWIPTSSTIWNNHLKSIDYFGFYPSTMIVAVKVANDDSILTPILMDLSYNVFNTIHNMEANNGNKNWKYIDFCQRAYPSSPSCISDTSNLWGNPTYFNFNNILWQSNISLIMSTINNPFVYPPIDIYLGGIQRDINNVVVSGEVLSITYYLEGTLNNEIYDAQYEFMYEFQTFWGNNYDSYNSNVTMYYFTDRAFDDEIARVAYDDIPIFIAALFVMLIYLMFTFGNKNICQRWLLAQSAICVLLCSLAIGFGISSLIGIEFNTINALVPYILLGVGVDDMIIIMDSFHNKNDIQAALSHSGLSITITSLCSICAFSIGSFIDLPGVRSFCVYSAFSFLANYILQFLIFVPFLVLDTRRLERKKQKQQICICDYKILKKISCSNLLSMSVIPCLEYRIIRWLIISVFIGLNIGSIYILQGDYLDTETSVTSLVPDDSFILDFFDMSINSYPIGTPNDLEIVIKNQDFSQESVRININKLL